MSEITIETSDLMQSSFERGDYENCSMLLEKSKSATNVDRFVLNSNSILIDFARSGWIDRDRYREEMVKLKEQVKPENQFSLNILRYNEALLSFHARQWSTTVQLLQHLITSKVPAFVRIESNLLLAETYLKLCNPERALLTLSNIESLVSSNPKATESQKHRHYVAKIRSCLMARNVRRCKKEVKSPPKGIAPHSSILALFKAHQEYLRENYRKSLRLISVAKEFPTIESGKRPLTAEYNDPSCVYNNSLGCNYAKLSKYHLAVNYFEKALNQLEESRSKWMAEKGRSAGDIPMHGHHMSTYFAIMHNYALALLQAGYVERAFDCFLQMVKIYPKNVRLWLRLAECCILARHKNNKSEFHLEQRRHECVQDVVGVGPHRKIVLNTNMSNRKRGPSEEGAVPSLSYEFAYLCVKNAQWLVPNVTGEQLRVITESPTGSSSSSERETILLWPCPPHSPLGVKEMYRLKCSILCASSYICLCIGEYQSSLESAKSLLSMEHVSPVHKLLANFYAAESLVRMDRPEEAATHLPLVQLADMSVTEFSASSTPPVDWYPKSAKSANMALFHNIGVVYNLLGETSKANESTKWVLAGIKEDSNGEDECPVLAIMHILYQLLQKDQTENARAFVFRYCQHLQTADRTIVT